VHISGKSISLTLTLQVFHITPLSYALVNLKPLLPGHVLVSPRRIVPRFNDLSAAEVQDLFLTVQRVSRTIVRVYDASAMNIAIQDGKDAGQSVPHLHAHIIPRKRNDLPETDAIYGMLEGEDGDMSRQFKHHTQSGPNENENNGRGKFPAVDADEDRKPRSTDVMEKEAEWLAAEMAKDTAGEKL
jgi:bis(5'-adenosyl)-triphosphatase